MNRNTSRFADDNHIIVLMNDANRLSSDWRLMTVQGMRYDIPIFNYRFDRRDGLPIDDDFARLNGVFLKHVSAGAWPVVKGLAHSIRLAGLETRLRIYQAAPGPSIFPYNTYCRYSDMGALCVGHLPGSKVEARDHREW